MKYITSSGRKFVTELSVSACRARSYTDLFDFKSELKMGHINLSRNVDIIVVAPATANFISRLAHGWQMNLPPLQCSHQTTNNHSSCYESTNVE